MITRVAFNLTDDERRAISGRRRQATRKEVAAFVERLVAAALQRGETPAMLPRPADPSFGRSDTMPSCTSLDHLYPLGPKTPDTPCYCGRRKWGAFSPAVPT